MFPHWGAGEWDRFARRICREEGATIRFDYDMAIAENFRRAVEQPPSDAWGQYRALEGRPVTILRGELSDLLSAATAERMATEIADAELVTVPDVGHTPSFEEPESIAALDRLLERVLGAGA